jgi:hypothetical protein
MTFRYKERKAVSTAALSYSVEKNVKDNMLQPLFSTRRIQTQPYTFSLQISGDLYASNAYYFTKRTVLAGWVLQLFRKSLRNSRDGYLTQVTKVLSLFHQPNAQLLLYEH